MKLYQCNNRITVRLLENVDGPPAHRNFKKGEVYKFIKVDGMYSLCYDEHGKIVHLPAWTEVEEVLDS